MAGRFFLFGWLVMVLVLGAGGVAQAQGEQAGRAIGPMVLDVPALPQPLRLYESSHALVIGVSDYTEGWPDLPGVKVDVEQVSAALRRQGFTVDVVADPTTVELRSTVNGFINRYGSAPGARLLIYYAGHGHTRTTAWGGDMGYIVAADCPRPDRDEAGFRATAIDMTQVEVWAKRIESKHAIFLFDSCFSGSIFALTRAVPTAISLKTAEPIRQFITSGAADQEVPDVSDFRREFVRALDGEGDANGDGYVTGTELGEFLYDRVTNYSRGAQTPQYGKIRNPMLDRGDFVFQVAAAAARPTPEAPPVVVDVPDFDLSGLQDRARQREQAAQSQRELRAAAEQAMQQLRSLDSNTYLTADDKAAAWGEYLDKLRTAGVDIAYAEQRQEFWENATPTPTATPVPTRTQRPTASPPPPGNAPPTAATSSPARASLPTPPPTCNGSSGRIGTRTTTTR